MKSFEQFIKQLKEQSEWMKAGGAGPSYEEVIKGLYDTLSAEVAKINKQFMPTHIIKLYDAKTARDYYMEWSTIVQVPITWGMTLDEFYQYYKEKYGTAGMVDLPNRLARTADQGCSIPGAAADDLLSTFDMNRPKVGDQREFILENFCRNHNTGIK